ncbi:MAG: hypothetical protein ACRCXT_19680 [Paraclostridium sp.]
MKYLLAVKTIFIHNKRFFMDVISYHRGSYYVVLRDKIEDVKKHLPVGADVKDVYIKFKDDSEIKRIYGDNIIDKECLRKKALFRNTEEEFTFIPVFSSWDRGNRGITNILDVIINVEVEVGTRKNHDVSCRYTKIHDDEFIMTDSFLFGREEFIWYNQNHGNFMCISNNMGFIENIGYMIPLSKEWGSIESFSKKNNLHDLNNVYVELGIHFNKYKTIHDMYRYVFANFNGEYDIMKLSISQFNNSLKLGISYKDTVTVERGYRFFKIKKYGDIISDKDELNNL